MSLVSRRTFLKCTGLSAVTDLAGLNGIDAVQKAPVVDTHLHCFAGSDVASFPYHKRAPYRPTQSASPESLLKCMDGAGVDYAIIVHPEPYQDDHRYLEHCLEVCGSRVKATCLFFADQPDSMRRMPSFLKKNDGKIVAARIHAYAPGRLPPFGRRELRQLWKTASDHGLAIQLHFEPRYAARFEPYLKEFDCPVIIDHMGRPMQGTPREHDVVIGWSQRPDTIMKIASVPDQNKYPHRNIRPVVRRLTEAYGADRVIYGGGFNSSATPESYRAYRKMVSGLIEHLSTGERAAVFGGTAARIFQFKPR